MSEHGIESIDYSQCKWTRGQLLLNCLKGCAVFFAIGMVFFRNFGLAGCSCGLVYLYIKERRSQAIAKRKSLLLDQFKEAMYALTSALSAGKSVEQAFLSSLKDLSSIYVEEEDIIIEWKTICHKLVMNESVEKAFLDFAQRSDLEDVDNFANVFIMAKKSGGNLVEIIEDTSQLISDKIEIQKEIDILIVQKQFEQKILSMIIPGMIIFFGVVSPEFLEPLYTTLSGRGIMVVALCMYLLAHLIGKKIVAIEV